MANEDWAHLAVDWPKRKIDELASKLEAAERDIKNLRYQLGEETRVRDRILEQAFGRINDLEKALNTHNKRISHLNAYGVPVVRGEYIDQRPLEEFLPPIGGRLFHAPKEPPVVSSLRTGGQRYQEWRRRSAELDYWAGEARKDALQQAADRVKEYLTKGQFSEAIIAKVLAAVWGAEGPSGEGSVE